MWAELKKETLSLGKIYIKKEFNVITCYKGHSLSNITQYKLINRP